MKQLLASFVLMSSYLLCGAQATSLTVDNQTPGWLSSKINYGDQQTVRNLTVTGYLNLTDLKFIGELMSKHNLNGHLNLTDVEVVDTRFKDSPTSSGESLTMFQVNNKVSVERFSIPKSLPEISPYLLARVQADTLDYGSERCQVLTKFLVTNRYYGTNYAPKVLILRDGLTIIQLFGQDEGAEKRLQTIILPQSIDSIGNNAFKGCSNLVSVNLPNTLHSIGEGAFADTSIFPDTLYLPNSLKTYYTNSFPIKNGQVIVLENGITHFNNRSWYLRKTDSVTFVINKVTPPIFEKGAGANSYSDGKELSGCTLYVPKEGYSMYADPEYNSVGGPSIPSGGSNPYSHAKIKTIHVGVENILLNQNSASLNVGSTLNLIATVLPSNADNSSLNWTSTNPNIASVNSDGIVSAIYSGNATIIASSVEDPSIFATCEVAVHQPLQSLALNPKSVNLNAGQQYDAFSLTFSPATADNKNVVWQSSNPEIANVDANGRVTAIKGGTTKIIAISLENENIKDESFVTVIQPVTGIGLHQSHIELVEDTSQQLIATVHPENATNKNVNWTSSDVSVAMVSPDGTVFAVKEGQATVMATTVDGGFVALCKVTVKAKTVLTDNLILSQESATLTVSETIQLIAELTPSNATNKTLHWSSTNSSVAKVSDTGLVTAVSEGKAQIIVTTTDGSNLSAICNIIVEKQFVLINSISLNPNSVRIPVGDNHKILPILSPADATNKNLIWSSTNNSVATISQDGVVDGVGEGKAVIIATTQDGSNLSATCEVEVYNEFIFISSIILNPDKIVGGKNTSYQIVATVVPANASNKDLSWFSSDVNIACVDSNGMVSLLSKGAATITATSTDGSNVKSECIVIVSEPAGIDDVLKNENEYVRIYSLTGALVFEGRYSHANLSSGTYIVLINNKAIKQDFK